MKDKIDLSQLNTIQTPKSWITDIANNKAKKRKTLTRSKFTVMLSGFIIASLFTVSAAAAVIPNFYSWLTAQFGKSASITELSGYKVTEDGFFIKNGETYVLKGTELKKINTKTVKGLKGESEYFIEYTIHGNKIHVQSHSGNVIDVTAYNEKLAIVQFENGSYFAELSTGALTEVLNEGVSDLQVSEGGKYLLYHKRTEEWFVKNIETKEEVWLQKAPEYLFSNEIGFIDDKRIVIGYNEQERPMIYDCETKEYTDLGTMPGSDFGTTLIYSTGYENGCYTFKDLLKKQEYEIPSQDTNNVVIVTREAICLLSPARNAVIYLIDEDKTVTFKSEALENPTEITDVKVIDKNKYLFITTDLAYIVSK